MTKHIYYTSILLHSKKQKVRKLGDPPILSVLDNCHWLYYYIHPHLKGMVRNLISQMASIQWRKPCSISLTSDRVRGSLLPYPLCHSIINFDALLQLFNCGLSEKKSSRVSVQYPILLEIIKHGAGIQSPRIRPKLRRVEKCNSAWSAS